MTVDLEIFKERRVVPVQFERAGRGNPSMSRPDLDDRGQRSDEHGPIMGLMQGRKVKVRLRRLLIDHAAPLFVTSSDEANVRVVDPADGQVPNGETTDIELEGISGGAATANTADIEVRFERADGPILQRLTAWCFARRRVRITPHLVTIAQTGGGAPSVTSGADVNAIMAIVQRVWRPCGITFTIGATQNDTVTLGTAGVLSDTPFPGEVRTLLTTNWVANTINAYFVPQIGTGGTLGYGFSRPSSVTFGTTNPGIILADRNALGHAPDTMWSGNDLAHEVGHFFQLWHPGQREPPNNREDTWCRRMLMHNFNTMGQRAGWRNDVGYGTHLGDGRRGCFITMKDVPRITTDEECTTARGAVVSGPY
jgi:hypothetical protein